MRAALVVAVSVVRVAIGYVVTEAFHPFGTPHLTTVVVVSDPLNRQSVTSALARNGEPLVIRLDMAEADPRSPIDAIFVPANQDVPDPPFELTLFKDVASAEEHARLLEDAAGPKAEVTRVTNAVLSMARTIPAERRARLMLALESLQ